MFWTVLIFIVAVLVMIKFLESLHLRRLTAQMYGNKFTALPTEQEEKFVVDLSVSFFREVMLNTKVPVWIRRLRLGLFVLWYVDTIAVGVDIFFVQVLLHINNIDVKGVAFLGSLTSLLLLMLFLLSGLMEIGMSKTKARVIDRETVWCDEHGLDEALKQKFISSARKVYAFDKEPPCKMPCWAFPIGIAQWIWVVIVVMIVTTGSLLAITRAETVPIILYGDLFLLLLGSIGGLIGTMYFVMRVAPWNGIAKGETSLPFCYLWNMINSC
jgi:hypothetical protein